MTSKRVVLATQNKGKIAEFERILSQTSSDVKVLGLADFPDMPDVEETGTTLTENALLKSRAIAAFTGLPALADDSGLFINALGGDPGVYSARWAGTHGDDRGNILKVLLQIHELEQNGPVDRAASFKCVITLSFPSTHSSFDREQIVEGEMKGAIIDQARGEAGFGYDPIFIPAGLTLTSAEISPELKDQLSHRGQALHKIAPILAALL